MLKLLAGLILVIVLVGTGAIAVAYWSFISAITGDVARLTAAANPPANPPITADRIAALPAPAQRYFTHAGVIGTTIPRLVHLTQKGRIRGSATDKWMALQAEETYSTNPPAFVWRAWFPTPAMPVALGRDEYLEGQGSILMKLLALVPLADEHGEELGAAGLMRYLNEMTWFPAALLADNVRISPVDDNSFTVTIADRGLTAQGTLIVDADGRLTNFRATRYNTSTRTLETWETPIAAEGPLAGLTLPTKGSAVWKLPIGDLDYIELEITAVSYED